MSFNSLLCVPSTIYQRHKNVDKNCALECLKQNFFRRSSNLALLKFYFLLKLKIFLKFVLWLKHRCEDFLCTYRVDLHKMNSIIVNLLARRSCDRIVVSTLRCGPNNPGSNPCHGK